MGKKPWGLFVHGRYDTTGAVRSVETIVGALPWRRAAPVLEVLGDPTDEQLAAAYELGCDAGGLADRLLSARCRSVIRPVSRLLRCRPPWWPRSR